MLRKRIAPVVILALLITPACNQKQAVAESLIALSQAAILANSTLDANGKPLLSTADTGAILQYANQGLVVIQASASGWKVALKTGWSAAVDDIQAKHPNAGTTLRVALAAVTAAIGAL
jgi:hypothetical protein